MSDEVVRRPGLVGALAAVVAGAWFTWQSSYVEHGARRFTLFDDATIALSFARTFGHGHGLVWYPGAPRVEGFTNPLWTVAMAVPTLLGLGLRDAPLAVSVMGVLCVAGCALLAPALASRLGSTGRFTRLAAALAVGLCYPLVFWSARGMEVGFVTVCVLGALVLALDLRARPTPARHAALAGLLIVGVATRLDFAVIGVAIALWAAADRGRPRAWVTAAWATTATAVAVGAVLGLQRWYYGQALPNTYYLKVAGVPLATRLERGAISSVHLLVAGTVAVLALAVVGTRAVGTDRRAAALPWTVAALLAAYSLSVGGDVWELFRFTNRYVTPGLVLLLVLGARAVEPIGRWVATRPGRRAVAVVGAVLAQVLLGPTIADRLGYDLDWLQIDAPTRELRWGAVLAAGTTLALVAVAARLAGSRAGRQRLGALLGVAALVGLALTPWPARATSTATAHPFTDYDAYMAEYGATLGAITRAGARVAVTWAGAPIYYSQRPGVDLLGKVDPVVARSKPHADIQLPPGHNRWDLRHSVGALRPDVVAQLWHAMTLDDYRWIVAQGYEQVRPRPGVSTLPPPPVLLVRRGSRAVRWDLVEPGPDPSHL